MSISPIYKLGGSNYGNYGKSMEYVKIWLGKEVFKRSFKVTKTKNRVYFINFLVLNGDRRLHSVLTKHSNQLKKLRPIIWKLKNDSLLNYNSTIREFPQKFKHGLRINLVLLLLDILVHCYSHLWSNLVDWNFTLFKYFNFFDDDWCTPFNITVLHKWIFNHSLHVTFDE